MKQKLKSLRFRMILPVFAMTLLIVILLTTLFSRAYTDMILKQEQEVNAVGFETISRSLTPLIDASVSRVRSLLTDDRVIACLKLRHSSAAEKIHARIRCRDYLRGEISREDGIFGLLFMRKDGSIFGTLPEGNLFLDDPEANPLPGEIRAQILSAPHGQVIWLGPVSGESLYGFKDANTPDRVMIAAWKNVDVSYDECYALMLMDGSIFDRQFSALRDGKSTWHLFSKERLEIFHTGKGEYADVERLIRESNTGQIFSDEDGTPVCAFSMTMESPAWTLVRKVSMEDYEKVIRGVRGSVALLAGVIFLVALALYELWLKKYMRQFRVLLKGITRMGQSDSEPITEKPSSITEFATMQTEINRTSLALNDQMNTIREMTAEKERISTEMTLAGNIQTAALPSRFPAFPDRREFDLYAFMTPARQVGGDFYDFFLIDDDHLALVIADVSGKGIPAALFMMVSKALIKNQLMAGCDPATALERANQQLCEGNDSMMFVTVWLAVVEISTGRGVSCNAGHENPALRRAGGNFEMVLYPHGLFLGARKKAKVRSREFELRPGDCLFVYTDGVPEANNAEGEMFLEERIVRTLNRDAGAAPEAQVRRMYDSLKSFMGDAEQFDDITMLCFRYCGSENEE